MDQTEQTSPEEASADEATAEAGDTTQPVEQDDADEQDSTANVKTPDFEELAATNSSSGSPIDRFYDVSVSISAELGRVSMPLGELLRIGEGAVVKLDRPVSAPVELMAQGVRVALGEVVVVDDCFAIRIREIETKRKTN